MYMCNYVHMCILTTVNMHIYNAAPMKKVQKKPPSKIKIAIAAGWNQKKIALKLFMASKYALQQEHQLLCA